MVTWIEFKNIKHTNMVQEGDKLLCKHIDRECAIGNHCEIDEEYEVMGVQSETVFIIDMYNMCWARDIFAP